MRRMSEITIVFCPEHEMWGLYDNGTLRGWLFTDYRPMRVMEDVIKALGHTTRWSGLEVDVEIDDDNEPQWPTSLANVIGGGEGL